jgi:rhamnosyltransferase
MTCDALVIMRCYNDEWVVGETLDAIMAQKDVSFRVVAIDSASQDRSVEIIRRYPVELIRIPAGSYIPGKVLNLGMEQGTEPFGVFVNSDCTPQHDRWMEKLLEPFGHDDEIAAVYGRQVPRPDAHPLVVKDYDRAFGDGSVAATWRHFFSMASSAIRRSIWVRHPFDPDIQYSEDVYWTWQLKKRGHRVSYAPESVAMHSHNYTVAEMRKRYAGEGRADATIYGAELMPSSWLAAVGRPFVGEVLRDWRYCAGHGHLGAALQSPVHRWVQRTSYWKAARRGLAEAA